MFFSFTFSQIISGQSLVFSTTRKLPVVRITSLGVLGVGLSIRLH
jgi:hypothetical protein